MKPVFPRYDFTDGRILNIELEGDLGHGFPKCVFVSYLDYLFFSKFRSWNSNSFCLASLFASVGHILHLCSNEKVIRTHAMSHITFMKYAKSIWNWTVCKHPRKSMRQAYRSAYCVRPAKVSVSVMVQAPVEKPTRISLMDITPKSTRIRAPSILISLYLEFLAAVGTVFEGHKKLAFLLVGGVLIDSPAPVFIAEATT